MKGWIEKFEEESVKRTWNKQILGSLSNLKCTFHVLFLFFKTIFSLI